MTDDAQHDGEREPDDLASSERRVVDPRTLPVRFSHLKAAGRSLAHARDAMLFDGDESLARRIGSGVHAMLLGKPVAEWNQPSKAAKEGKSKASGKKPSKAPRSGSDWEAFKLGHAGHVILTAKEFAHATAVSAAIRNHPVASRIIFAEDSIHEQTILWSQNGRARRTTPDVRSSFVAELKTTRDASLDRFPWDARKMFYHAQVADQCAAIEAKTGRRPREAFIVAVETARPYVVQVYELSRTALEQGAELCDKWLDAIVLAEQTDVWSGYHRGIVELDVPTDAGTYFADEEESDEEAAPA